MDWVDELTFGRCRFLQVTSARFFVSDDLLQLELQIVQPRLASDRLGGDTPVA
jgi:hypothetical protein